MKITSLVSKNIDLAGGNRRSLSIHQGEHYDVPDDLGKELIALGYAEKDSGKRKKRPLLKESENG